MTKREFILNNAGIFAAASGANNFANKEIWFDSAILSASELYDRINKKYPEVQENDLVDRES